MKKTIRSLSLVVAFAMMAALLPLMGDSIFTAYAASDFQVNGTELWKYTGSDAEVTIPSNITSIGEKAFSNNLTLKSVKMSSGMNEIKANAFSGCTALESIQLPDSITAIGANAFSGCNKLVVQQLPAALTSISSEAFKGCTGITEFEIATTNPTYETSNGVLYCKTDNSLVIYPAGKTAELYTIRNGTESVSKYAFYQNTYLKRVNFTSKVSSIGAYAFANCTNLATIPFLPEAMTSIGGCAFLRTAITSINIPSKVTSLGGGVFADCRSLSKITVADGNTSFKILADALIDIDETKIYAFPAACSRTIYSMPDTVDTILYGAFWGNRNLKGVSISTSVTGVGYYTFRECASLKIVGLYEGITVIGDSMFMGCKELTTVTIPSSVTSIGGSAFYGTSITTVNWNAISPNFSNLTFPNTVTTIKYAGTEDDWSAMRNKNGKTVDYAFVSGTAPTPTFNSGKIIVITQPKQRTPYKSGESVTLTTEARSNGAGTLSYQWYYKLSNDSAWSKWNGDGANTNTISFRPDDDYDNTAFYCVISGSETGSIRTNEVSLKLVSPIRLNNALSDQTVNLGDSLTLNVSAQGDNLSYQWYYKKKGQTEFSVWNNRTHASETVTPNATWDGIKLYCKITDAGGNTKNTNTITVTVTNNLKITQQPVSKTIALGDSLTVSLKASGSGLKYQWYFKKKGQSDFSIWNGHTHASETCTPNATWDGIQLYCKVTDDADNFVNSDIITITVQNKAKITQQPVNKTINLGDSVTVSLKATGNGLKYQWYFKKKGQSSFSPWNNRTHASETCTPNATWDGIQLYCEVSDSYGTKVNSNTITVTVNQGITITQQPKDQYIVLGKSLTLTVKATGSSLKYQWYFMKKGQTAYTLWSGRTHASETVTPNATWDGIKLYCKISDGNGKSVDSSVVTVSVLSISTQPKSQTITLGSSLTISVKATGSGLKYQWYFMKASATDWSKWNGRTHASETVTPNATWNGIRLYCLVTDGAGNIVKSEPATITVK